MYIKQNKIIQLEEPKYNIELYNIQLKFQHTPVQLNGLVWVTGLNIAYNSAARILQQSCMQYK